MVYMVYSMVYMVFSMVYMVFSIVYNMVEVYRAPPIRPSPGPT